MSPSIDKDETLSDPTESDIGVESDEPKDETEDEPKLPKPEDYPSPPIAPASVNPAAVTTVEGGKKYGWQDAPVRTIPEPQACVHIGTVSAKAQIVVHEVGHEWICDCGQVFVVKINSGGKKTLVMKEEVDD